MNEDSIPDFSGKCISLRVESSEYSHDLYDPSFEYQGGQLFILGKIPEGASASGWDVNKIGGVSWGRVLNYTLFDNLEDYKKAVQISEKYEADENT